MESKTLIIEIIIRIRFRSDAMADDIISLMKPDFKLVYDDIKSLGKEVVWRGDMKNEDEVKKFIEDFSMKTNTNWINYYTNSNPQKILFQKTWLCQYGKKNKKCSSKRDAGCNATITVVIKKNNKDTRKNDMFLKLDPPLVAVIKLKPKHNHDMDTADYLRMRRVAGEVKNQFMSYFDLGMGASEAQRFHESKLLADKVSDEVLADAGINPTQAQVNYFHSIWCSKHSGPALNKLERLEERCRIYEEKGSTVRCDKSNPWSIVIVTPIMKRAHDLRAAGEIVFVDSTTSYGSSHTVTVMLTPSKMGAIPICVVIHESQAVQSYAKSFNLLKANFPSCFDGRPDGPSIFMTDDSSAEKSALKTVWPSALQFLCHFHVSRVEWKWLHLNIPADNRAYLMRCFHTVMHAENKNNLSEALQNILSSSFPDFVSRFCTFYNRKAEWVKLHQHSLITSNNDMINLSEVTLRILKDILYSQTKAFNVVALCELWTSVWERYLKLYLLDYIYDRQTSDDLLYSSLSKKMKAERAHLVQKLDNSIYLVPSGTKNNIMYLVNTDAGTCTCHSGKVGGFCKHQCLLANKRLITLPNMLPVSTTERYALGLLALGNECPPFKCFTQFNSVSNEIKWAVQGVSNESMMENAEKIDSEDANSLSNPPVSFEVKMVEPTESEKQEIDSELKRIGSMLKEEASSEVFTAVLNGFKKMKKVDDIFYTVSRQTNSMIQPKKKKLSQQ